MSIDQNALSEFSDFGRLNVSVVGIGEWGCDVLKAVVQRGLSYALTLALPTSENNGYLRHPATRVLPIFNSSHIDRVSRFLVDSDLIIFIISGKIQNDIDLAQQLSKAINCINSCKSIAITDIKTDFFVGLSQKLSDSSSSTLYLDNVEAGYVHNVVSGYISTILNIMFNHRIIGVEYSELVSFTGDDLCYKLSAIQNIKINVDRIHEIPTLLSNATTPTTKRLIICIEYNNSFNPNEVDNIQFNYGIEAHISFVPNKSADNYLILTAILFE